jgi:hypothetical protein
VDRIQLARNKVQFQVLMKTIMKFRVPEKMANFFSRSSRRTFPHRINQLAPFFLVVYYTTTTVSRKRRR